MRDASRLSVRVQPRASRNEIVGFDAAGVLRVRVTAPPVDGAANKAVVEVLAAALDVPKADISIASGQTGRLKMVDVEGMSEAEARRRLGVKRG
jgi:uncharacterized protein (TIGR00251 family)